MFVNNEVEKCTVSQHLHARNEYFSPSPSDAIHIVNNLILSVNFILYAFSIYKNHNYVVFHGDKEAFAFHDDKKPIDVEIPSDEKYHL